MTLGLMVAAGHVVSEIERGAEKKKVRLLFITVEVLFSTAASERLLDVPTDHKASFALRLRVGAMRY